MANIAYNNVKIIGMSACVPRNISSNTDLLKDYPIEESNKIINNIGIKEKRYVDNETTASDLCFKSAETLLNEMNIDRSSIDMLIFLSQLPDYKIPATSPILQDRLGLSKDTACFDISLACSGYVYALSNAFAYASQNGINRVLLLVGETFSKIVSPKDRVNAPLYGDAGTATLIEKTTDANSEVFFSLYSDGSGFRSIVIEAGGARCPTNSTNIIPVEKEDGNIRSDSQVYMDGLEVFNFTLKVVPTSINEILKKTNKEKDQIDYYLFHQANKFMIDFFVKKLKIDPLKVPISLDAFGNVSSPTIPLTIVSRLKNELHLANKQILLSGFGAGLSWGAAILNLTNCHISDLIEY
jgi:3-oxoacyl-[acyl-carrier-protein] synthase-3